MKGRKINRFVGNINDMSGRASRFQGTATETKVHMAYFQITQGEIHIGKRTLRLPRARGARIVLGLAFIAGGLLGFLPVLGFWMLPLGFLILSQDVPVARRWRRRMTVAWARRRKENSGRRQ
mgnify:CR=1 FL=1